MSVSPFPVAMVAAGTTNRNYTGPGLNPRNHMRQITVSGGAAAAAATSNTAEYRHYMPKTENYL